MSTKRALTASMIALINLSAICNIKNFPLFAEYGLSIIIFLALASIFFFVPAAFVSAELASGWPERGVYTWVTEALGPKMGFMAIWLQWIENVIYYPTLLAFIAGSTAYMFDPQLANNKLYVISIVLITFWGATLINFLGMKVSGIISFITALCGTILPVVLITLLGIVWLFHGYPSQISFNWHSIVPELTSFSDLVLLSGILFGLSGVEMSSVHAKDVIHPRTSYPKGIFLSVILILFFSTIGALSIAVIVPKKEILLASGGMEAFRVLLIPFHLEWLMPVIGAVVSFGALGMLSTWIVGPSRGLYATAIQGNLPPIFHRSNKKEMPVGILITQGIIVSILSLLFYFMPSVNSSYWMFLALSSLLYQLMYILMFISGIVLRYKFPHVERGYSVPFGKKGMWVIASLGMLGSSFGFCFCFIPPSQFETGAFVAFEAILIGCAILFCSIPFLIYSLRKPSWKLKEDPRS